METEGTDADVVPFFRMSKSGKSPTGMIHCPTSLSPTIGLRLISLRMDMQYASLKLLFENKSYYAPVKNPQSILDVGTGTGMDGNDL